MRAAMGDAAVAAARAIAYRGAGTIEFIVGADRKFFFMEMNTRLQVEHPVTEMITGEDLVEWQLRVAAGEPLPLRQAEIHSGGHSIEVRLCAENPANDFLPEIGRIGVLRAPPGALDPHDESDVRLDTGVREGDEVSVFYDPMIAKLIVFDTDRPRALLRLREALAECEIAGPKSNIAFLERLARHPVVVEGRIDTGYLDRHLDEFLVGDVAPPDYVLFAAATAALLHDECAAMARTHGSSDPFSPWSQADAWRVGHEGRRLVALERHGHRYEVEAYGHAGHYRMRHGDDRCEVSGARHDGEILSARFDGDALRLGVRADATRVLLHDVDGQRHHLGRAAAYAWKSSDAVGGNQLAAPMPGRIVLVKAAAGDEVAEGQELIVMEAMKMELALKAPRAGIIESLSASQGDFVEADTVLVRFATE